MSRTISTTLTSGITLTSGDNPATITSSGRITDSSNSAILAEATLVAGWTVSNYGTLISGGASSPAVRLQSYGHFDTFTNQSGGLITSAYTGLQIDNSGVVINQANATISSSSSNTYASAVLIELAGTIVNAGLLQAANVISVYELAGGSVTNQSGGTISGAGGVFLKTPGTVTNAGTIIGTNAADGAVQFASNASANRLIVDPGAVFSGDIISLANSTNVIELASSASTGTLAGFDGSSITNFATLAFDSGAAWTVTGNSAASGLGSIAITGFAAGDTIDLTGFAAVSKTFASNALVLTNASNAHATLHIQGAFTSSDFALASDGATGTDIFLGTTAAAALVYGQTIDQAGIVAASETVTAGVMTLFNAGNTAVGTISVGTSVSTGDFILRPDGAGGTDVIVATVFGTYTSGVTLLTNPTTIAATGKATNTAASGKAVSGPSGTNWTLVNQGLISETASNGIGVSLAQSGTITNAASGTITAAGTAVVLAGGGLVTNASGGIITGYSGVLGQAVTTVVNAGSIGGNASLGSAAGVYLAAGGSVTNQSGGTITGYDGVKAGAAATVVNAGLITGNYTLNANDSGIYLSAGGSVTNQSGGTISGSYYGVKISGARGTVVNLGRIATHDSGFGRQGVYLADGGVVTNGAPGGTASSAYILGYNGGVRFGPTGSDMLVNYGTISGNPGYQGVLMTTGTLINGASGATGALIESGLQNNAVLISGAGTVVNYGTIDGAAANGESHISYGVSLGGSGTVASSISNLGSNALIEGYVAVYAAQNATITNAGTMEATQVFGGTPPIEAVIFGGGTNRLIIDPGAVFIGGVNGSGAVTVAPGGQTTVLGTANGVGTTTLELASAASAGTLSGLGSKYVGFSAVTIDSGAQWTFAGSNTLASGITLTNSGTLTDSGTFTNAGLVTGAAKGIILTTGARITNQSGGTITGSSIGVSASGVGTVVNAGLISGNPTVSPASGISFAAGGSVTNQAGGTITGARAISAQAGTLTVVNAGSIGGGSGAGKSGIALNGSGVVSNQSGGVITGNYGIVAYASGATITNAGTLSGVYAVLLNGAGGLTNQSGGTISGSSEGVLANAVATVVNAGGIAGVNYGVQLAAGGTVIAQSGGTISSTGMAVSFGANRTNRLVIDPGATFTGRVDGGNTLGATSISTLELASSASTGTFTALNTQFINFARVTVDAGASWTFGGSNTLAAHATLTNAGTILDTGTTGLRLAGGYALNQAGGLITNSAGAAVYGVASTASSMVNLGTLDGEGVQGYGVWLAGGGSVINGASTATSTLVTASSAGILISGTAGTVTNAGRINTYGGNSANAGVYLRAGGSATNLSSGTITAIYGVEARNIAATVINAGFLGNIDNVGAGLLLASGGSVTNQAGGTIIGNRGVNASMAATVTNAGSIAGGTISGVGIYLAAGGTVTALTGGIISGGADAVKFAAGATNLLAIDPGAIFTGTVDGGNTIAAAFVSTLELASGAPAGTLTGLGSQFVNFAQTTIDANANWTLSGTNSVAAGATLTNSGTLTDTGTLFNSGVLTGNRFALDGGVLTNQAGGVLTATYIYGAAAAGSDTVVNLGTITSGSGAAIYLQGPGAVTNAASGTITGYTDAVKLGGTIATVTNLGTIKATQGIGSYGINLFNGGLVTNGQAGTGTSTARIEGYYGVAFKNAAGTLSNYGTIIGDGDRAVDLGTAGGSLVNGASGATGALIEGFAYGVYVGAGSVTNFATIIASSQVTPAWGVDIQTTGTVSNLGTAGLIEGYGGVRIDTGGTVINAGTIESNQGTAGVAVDFIGGNARLIDNPGAVFVGSIFGGTGVLELASAASAGTIAGLGSTVTNFTSLVFDTGAQWTVAGNDSASGFGALAISGFTIGDTIDLTGFAAAGRTFSSNALVLDNGSGGHATLAIQGSFSSPNFVIAPDGSGGTDITFQNVYPPSITGTTSGRTVNDNATALPFSGVTIGDANPGGQSEAVTIIVTAGGSPSDANGTLSGTGLIETSTGTYELTAGSTAAVTTALDALVFTPTAHQAVPGGTVTTGFTIAVTDTLGESATDTTTSIVTTAINDPPVISGAVAGQTVNDNATGQPFSGITITDPDLGASESITITLTDGGNASDADGTLSGTGITKTGTGTYTLTTGSPADVTTALEAVVFTPTPHAMTPGSTITTGMTLSVTDGIVGSPVTDTTTSVTTTAVNDPPVISGAVAGQTVNDNATTLPFSGVTITDPDAGATESITITLTDGGNASDADGTLSGTGITKTGTGTYTLTTGSPAGVTTALEAVVFTPTPHAIAPGDTITTGMTLSATDGIVGSPIIDTTTSVTTTALNDPPVISGAVAGQTVNDTATDQPFSSVTVTDPDAGATESITITLTDGGNASDADGTLSGTGITKTGTGTYTLTAGSPADVTAALDAVVFTPTAHAMAPGDTITTGMTLSVTDGIIGSPITDTTTSVTTTAVNDPPVISGAVAGQTVNDNATGQPFSGITITDPDLGASESITITLTDGGNASDADGTLSGTGITKTGTGTYTLTTGSPADVTTALEAVVFTPTPHAMTPGSTITTGMTLSVTDGIVGSPVTDTTTSVTTTAVNDPPVISGAVAGQTVNDNATTLPFSGVTITDPDAGATESITITLTDGGNASDADGTLSGTGITKTGTGTYTLTTGSPAGVTTALEAVVFTPTPHAIAPGDTITTGMTLSATDGIVGSPIIDTTTSVTTTALNDPPVITGTVAGQTVNDNATDQPFSGITITDPDFGASESITITLTDGGNASDADGTLSGTGVTKTGTGTYTLTTGSPAGVTAALEAVLFTPTPHAIAPGDTITTGMTLSVTDGIVGSPIIDTTTSVTTTAVNDPPVISGTVADQAGNDGATMLPFSSVTITDPDLGASETITITLTHDGVASDAEGRLSGTGITRTGIGTYTLTTGSPAGVTAALDAATFVPAQREIAPGTSIVTGMTIAASDGIVGSPVTDTVTSVDIVPCFAAGTRLATPRGSIPVERLREGDMLLTVSGKPRPVQWIGRRTLDCTRHIAPERVKPIRIAAHAFGENRPSRALLLSPDHSVFVEDVLIPARHLVNGTTVTQIEVRTVTYYHIELPVHDILLAEGLPAESYLETGGRFAFENGGGAMQLHPDFAPDEARVGMVWRNFGYAPLIGSNGEVDRVRARLACQAQMLGFSADGGPQPDRNRKIKLTRGGRAARLTGTSA